MTDKVRSRTEGLANAVERIIASDAKRAPEAPCESTCIGWTSKSSANTDVSHGSILVYTDGRVVVSVEDDYYSGELTPEGVKELHRALTKALGQP